MRIVDWSALKVCKRGKKELHHLRSTHSYVDYSADHGWMYLSSIVIAVDNLLVQSLEAFSRASLRELKESQILREEFQRTVWETRDFDDVVLGIFEAGKVAKAKADGYPISNLPPYIIKKPNETLRLFNRVCTQVPDNISAAVAANFSIFNEIKPFRNYYAHQCEATALKLRSAVSDLRGQYAKKPDDLLLNRRTRNRRPLIEVWTEELDDFFNILAEYHPA